jgi:hypothetical protein
MNDLVARGPIRESVDAWAFGAGPDRSCYHLRMKIWIVIGIVALAVVVFAFAKAAQQSVREPRQADISISPAIRKGDVFVDTSTVPATAKVATEVTSSGVQWQGRDITVDANVFVRGKRFEASQRRLWYVLQREPTLDEIARDVVFDRLAEP